MGNLIEEIAEDANAVQEKLLGPTYPYYKNVKMPSDIGMSSKGSISALTKDIDGLIAYVEVLVTGKSKASATGGPLGNKFFLKTGAKCKSDSSNNTTDESGDTTDGSNNEVDRYIYVNNVPDGNIPFISAGLGTNFSEFRGLVPGAMSDLNVLNPFAIMQAFMAGSTPPCQELTLETIDNDNNKSTETHYVATTDIKNMNACSFSDGKNPVSDKSCKSAFTTYPGVYQDNGTSLPQDILVQIYFLGLSLIGIYIFMKLMEKSR
jgi:hypothetical protein